jgi:predicted transposase YdaD
MTNKEGRKEGREEGRKGGMEGKRKGIPMIWQWSESLCGWGQRLLDFGTQ